MIILESIPNVATLEKAQRQRRE